MSQEIDLAPARDCVGLMMRQVSRVVTRHYDAALRPVGLRNSQFSLLVMLEQGGAVPIGRLAAALQMDRTTLTRNASALEKRGLLSIDVDADDRRGRVVRLTEQGRRAAYEAFPLWQQAQREIAERVGNDALADILAGTGVLAARLTPEND